MYDDVYIIWKECRIISSQQVFKKMNGCKVYVSSSKLSDDERIFNVSFFSQDGERIFRGHGFELIMLTYDEMVFKTTIEEDEETDKEKSVVILRGPYVNITLAKVWE